MSCPLLIEVIPDRALRIGIRTDLLSPDLIDELAALLVPSALDVPAVVRWASLGSA
jgi:hypothetical protein